MVVGKHECCSWTKMAKLIDSDSSGPSKVHSWLNSLSPGLKLERLSTQFENRGFSSRRSLAYVKSEDRLDAFFPCPDKLLLAERHVLEAELKNLWSRTALRSTSLEPRRLEIKKLEKWEEGRKKVSDVASTRGCNWLVPKKINIKISKKKIQIKWK